MTALFVCLKAPLSAWTTLTILPVQLSCLSWRHCMPCALPDE